MVIHEVRIMGCVCLLRESTGGVSRVRFRSGIRVYFSSS